MEGEGVVSEFQDWEVLANSDSDVVNTPNSVDDSRNFEETEADSEGIIKLDYFSIDYDNSYAKTAVIDSSEDSDPSPETRYQRRDSDLFWADSGSDRSDGVKNEVGLVGNVDADVLFEGVGESDGKHGNFETFEGEFGHVGGKSQLGFEENIESLLGAESFGDIRGTDKDLAPKFWPDSGGDRGVVFGDAGKLNMESKVEGELEGGNCSKEGTLSAVAEVEEGKLGGGRSRGGGEEEKRKLVWWKVPFEVLRYCVFRVSPVWSFSMAAAVLGFVILGRRFYKTKRKPRTLQLKVTMDDKKVPRVMSRAARLNEAFSVVRRVPIVRPLLPASGLNPWPVMSMR